jgi:hypothetical protein
VISCRWISTFRRTCCLCFQGIHERSQDVHSCRIQDGGSWHSKRLRIHAGGKGRAAISTLLVQNPRQTINQQKQLCWNNVITNRFSEAGSGVLTTINMSMTSWDVTPCCVVDHRRFGSNASILKKEVYTKHVSCLLLLIYSSTVKNTLASSETSASHRATYNSW